MADPWLAPWFASFSELCGARTGAPATGSFLRHAASLAPDAHFPDSTVGCGVGVLFIFLPFRVLPCCLAAFWGPFSPACLVCLRATAVVCPFLARLLFAPHPPDVCSVYRAPWCPLFGAEKHVSIVSLLGTPLICMVIFPFSGAALPLDLQSRVPRIGGSAWRASTRDTEPSARCRQVWEGLQLSAHSSLRRCLAWYTGTPYFPFPLSPFYVRIDGQD